VDTNGVKNRKGAGIARMDIKRRFAAIAELAVKGYKVKLFCAIAG